MQKANERILFLYGLSIVLGLMTGTVASLFQLSIRWFSGHLDTLYRLALQHQLPVPLISALISMVLVFIAWLMVRYIAPEGGGSGVQEIEGALLHKRLIYWRRLLPVKFIGGCLSITSKMVLGREGPTIQMGGNMGEMIGEMANVHRHRRNTLVAAGSAAGLAAAFNAPLAGVLFVIEEMRDEFNFSFINFKMVAICCIFATIMLHIIIGPQADIPMPVFQLPSLQSLWLFFIFGIIVGFVGLGFNKALMGSLNWLDKQPSWFKFLHVPLVGLIVGYLAIIDPRTVGGGYEIIHQSLTMSPGFQVLSLLILVRFVTTIACYSTGVPGGIFAPMLALGTLLGLASAEIFQRLDLFYIFEIDPSLRSDMFAVAGMGALFSAAVRAPITGIVLVVEMTSNYELILPLMVSCLTSTTIVQLANNPPIYTQLLHRTLKLAKSFRLKSNK